MRAPQLINYAVNRLSYNMVSACNLFFIRIHRHKKKIIEMIAAAVSIEIVLNIEINSNSKFKNGFFHVAKTLLSPFFSYDASNLPFH